MAPFITPKRYSNADCIETRVHAPPVPGSSGLPLHPRATRGGPDSAHAGYAHEPTERGPGSRAVGRKPSKARAQRGYAADYSGGTDSATSGARFKGWGLGHFRRGATDGEGGET